MRKIQDTIGIISIIAFLVWLYCVWVLYTDADSWKYYWPGWDQPWTYRLSERPDYPVLATSFCIWVVGIPLMCFTQFIIKIVTFILCALIALISKFYYHPLLHKTGDKLFEFGEWK